MDACVSLTPVLTRIKQYISVGSTHNNIMKDNVKIQINVTFHCMFIFLTLFSWLDDRKIKQVVLHIFVLQNTTWMWFEEI